MKWLLLFTLFLSQASFAQSQAGAAELAKNVPIADVHMHLSKQVGSGFPPLEALKGMNESNVKWGGGVGSYSQDAQQSLGNRYIPAFGQREFFKVLYEKGESGLLDLNNFSEMFTEAEELFKAGKIKGFGEIHTSNRNSADNPNNKRDIRMKSPVIEKMLEMADRYKGFVAVHNEYSQQTIQDIQELATQYPNAALVLDHCLFGATPSSIRSLLSKTSNVYCEVSSNGVLQIGPRAAGMMRIHGGWGGIKGEWRDLITEFPDRFMVGSDACCGLGTRYNKIIEGLRTDFLANLPYEIVEKVAYKNAVRVFDLSD